MADDDRDILDQEMNDRLFGAPFESPLSLPGANGQDQFRDIYEGMPNTDAGAFAPPPSPNRPLVLSPTEQAKANYLRDLLLKMIRSTNITAALPAHSKPMLYSEPVDLSANYTLAAAVSADYVTVLSYKVPSGRWARFDGYGVDVDGGFTYDGSILWNIRVNGLSVNTLRDWGQQRGTISIPRKTFIIVKEDQTIDFQVMRAAAAGGDNEVTMALKGWTWITRRTYDGTKASITAY